MKIAILFDGAGLARLGFEEAGHECTGYDINPISHHFSKMVGSGNCVLADVRDIDLSEFDAAWCSPPCQRLSMANTGSFETSQYSESFLSWSLNLQTIFPNLKYLWVENIMCLETRLNDWGITYNAGQFTPEPLQNRNRVIGGFYPRPEIYRAWRKLYDNICPCITATEYKASTKDQRRAARFYGRRLTMEECAYFQGFDIPKGWMKRTSGYTWAIWRQQIYKAIGNGVPVYMANAFAVAARDKRIVKIN